MDEFQITHKRHDKEKVVTHVQLNELNKMARPVSQIMDWIENNTHTFYTKYKQIKAKVRVQTNSTTGKKYLISKADGTTGNNIDNLPDC